MNHFELSVVDECLQVGARKTLGGKRYFFQVHRVGQRHLAAYCFQDLAKINSVYLMANAWQNSPASVPPRLAYCKEVIYPAGLVAEGQNQSDLVG